MLRARVDCEVGRRFAVPRQTGERPVHGTLTETYRPLRFSQHKCALEMRTPRVKLYDWKIIQLSAAGREVLRFPPAVRRVPTVAASRAAHLLVQMSGGRILAS